MIIPSCFFWILAILPTITEQATQYSSKNSILDWSKCGEETKCYCKEDQSSSLEYMWNGVEKEPEPLPAGDTAGKCDVGVQSKFFTKQTAVILLQVLGTPHDPVDVTKLMLYQGPDELFGCKFEKGKVEVVGDSNKIKSSRVDEFETRSHCKKGSCFCALKIGRANKLAVDARVSLFQSKQTTIKLIINNQEEVYASTRTGNGLYLLKLTTCDPYSFKEVPNSPEYIIYQQKQLENKDKTSFDCESYGTPEIRYSMRYEKTEDNQPDEKGEIKRLQCARENPNDGSNLKYVFSMVKDVKNDATGVVEEKTYPIASPELYAFFCTAPIDRICDNPNPDCDPAKDPKCPIFVKGAKETAASLKCKDDKWLIDDEYYVLEEQVVCKKDAVSGSNDVMFFITPPSGVERKVPDVTKAQCFTESKSYTVEEQREHPLLELVGSGRKLTCDEKNPILCHDISDTSYICKPKIARCSKDLIRGTTDRMTYVNNTLKCDYEGEMLRFLRNITYEFAKNIRCDNVMWLYNESNFIGHSSENINVECTKPPVEELTIDKILLIITCVAIDVFIIMILSLKVKTYDQRTLNSLQALWIAIISSFCALCFTGILVKFGLFSLGEQKDNLELAATFSSCFALIGTIYEFYAQKLFMRKIRNKKINYNSESKRKFEKHSDLMKNIFGFLALIIFVFVYLILLFKCITYAGSTKFYIDLIWLIVCIPTWVLAPFANMRKKDLPDPDDYNLNSLFN